MLNAAFVREKLALPAAPSLASARDPIQMRLDPIVHNPRERVDIVRKICLGQHEATESTLRRLFNQRVSELVLRAQYCLSPNLDKTLC